MESVNKTNKSNGFKLSVLTLAIMNITAVVSLRGLATEAIYGPYLAVKNKKKPNESRLPDKK